jgi:hypothetical protein
MRRKKRQTMFLTNADQCESKCVRIDAYHDTIRCCECEIADGNVETSLLDSL